MSRNQELHIGDIVRINDGSYAERLDKYDKFTNIGLCKDYFKVIKIMQIYKVICGCPRAENYFHDIHIKNLITGAIYLHSSSFVTLVKSNSQRLNEIDLQLNALKREKEAILNDCI